MYQGILTIGDLDIAWRTVWQEARNQPYVGKLAVAWVLRNRLEYKPGDRWATLAQVCLDWLQFSGWRDQDKNLQASMVADLDGLGRECLRSVLEAFAGDAKNDPTRGARHYYAPKAMPTPPAWAVGHQPSAIIQDHYFFTGVQ